MAALKRNSGKGRKKSSRRSILCFFGDCFGIPNKVSSDHREGKLVKDGSKGKPVPVNDQALIGSSREIHVVESQEEIISAQLPVHEVIDDKTDGMDSKKKNRKLDESSGVTSSTKAKNSTPLETRTEPAKLSRAVPLPFLPCKKEKAIPIDKKGKKGKKDKMGKKDKELITAGEFDSIFGALIIMVTLTVMLMGGKVCAILCTAAWMYFIPRLRANFVDDYALKHRITENYVDLDSKEHKKKVVLQGLLDRSQHF